jgi:hypothetical protein
MKKRVSQRLAQHLLKRFVNRLCQSQISCYLGEVILSLPFFFFLVFGFGPGFYDLPIFWKQSSFRINSDQVVWPILYVITVINPYSSATDFRNTPPTPPPRAPPREFCLYIKGINLAKCQMYRVFMLVAMT